MTVLLDKINATLRYSTHPREVMESDFEPNTTDYNERRKLMRQAQTEIRRNEKDLDELFHSILGLQPLRTDLKFLSKTAFNTQGIESLASLYGEASAIHKNIRRLDKKLSKTTPYDTMFSDFSELVEYNMFDVFCQDFLTVIPEATVRWIEFNKANVNFMQHLDQEPRSQRYVEKFKEGEKKK